MKHHLDPKTPRFGSWALSHWKWKTLKNIRTPLDPFLNVSRRVVSLSLTFDHRRHPQNKEYKLNWGLCPSAAPFWATISPFCYLQINHLCSLWSWQTLTSSLFLCRSAAFWRHRVWVSHIFHLHDDWWWVLCASTPFITLPQGGHWKNSRQAAAYDEKCAFFKELFYILE